MIRTIKKTIRSLLSLRKKKKPEWFRKDYATLTAQARQSEDRFILLKSDFYPCLYDRTKTTPIDRHYIYHPAWAARIIARTAPPLHIDISSTLHFSTMLSAFVKTEFYDYRPADVELDNFTSAKADLTNLHFATDSIESLSCMHTIEHIGLGRYGDPMNYDGDLKAMRELARVLAPGGCLLMVVPVGQENKILFNAHRIYTASAVSEAFGNFGIKIVQFAYIPQKTGGMVEVDIHNFTTSDSYGCGCFWFTK